MLIIKMTIDISAIKFRMPCSPYMIPTSVISHPVDQHFETQFVCLIHHPSEILYRTKLRIGSHIIRTGIIASERTQSTQFADGRNRHEPEYFNTHVPQPW